MLASLVFYLLVTHYTLNRFYFLRSNHYVDQTQLDDAKGFVRANTQHTFRKLFSKPLINRKRT